MTARELYEKRDRLNRLMAVWKDWRSFMQFDGVMMSRMEAITLRSELNERIDRALARYFKYLNHGTTETTGEPALEGAGHPQLLCKPIGSIENVSPVPHTGI